MLEKSHSEQHTQYLRLRLWIVIPRWCLKWVGLMDIAIGFKSVFIQYSLRSQQATLMINQFVVTAKCTNSTLIAFLGCCIFPVYHLTGLPHFFFVGENVWLTTFSSKQCHITLIKGGKTDHICLLSSLWRANWENQLLVQVMWVSKKFHSCRLWDWNRADDYHNKDSVATPWM